MQTLLKNIIFPPTDYREAEQGTLHEMDTNVQRTGNLPSDGGFFISDPDFDESCFKRDLKIIILVLLRLFKFC